MCTSFVCCIRALPLLYTRDNEFYPINTHFFSQKNDAIKTWKALHAPRHILRNVIIRRSFTECWEPHHTKLRFSPLKCCKAGYNWNMFFVVISPCIFHLCCNSSAKHSAIKWSNWAYSLHSSLNLSSHVLQAAQNTSLDKKASTCLDNSYYYHYNGSGLACHLIRI